MKTRLSNSFLIGEIFGMVFFGMLIDRMGRRAGVVAATVFLVLGIVLSSAAHGTSLDGYVSRWQIANVQGSVHTADNRYRLFWMMVISRGVAGFGAGGEYPTCATGATEAADESASVRANRGVLVALSTLFAIDMVITPKLMSSFGSSLISS